MNTIVTASVIAKETLRAFVNALSLGQNIDMQYKDEFATGGAVGKSVTVNVKKPARFTVASGEALQLQDVLEESVPLTVQYRDQVAFQFSSADLALGIVKFRENYLTPAANALASKFDTRVADLYKKVWNYAGVPGTVPTASLTYSGARTALGLEGAPDENVRRMVINGNMQANIVNDLRGLLNPVPEISQQFKRGVMGRALGFVWGEDNNITAHTTGALGGTPTVNGANQTGASIITQAWTSAVANRLKEGDVVQFAGVFGVNPLTFRSTGVLKNFVVTADVASTSGGAATIPISPSIVLTGSTQTCTASPADAAAVTIFGHASTYASKVSPQGLAFHPKAITAAFVDLPLPRGADMAARISDPELGISMRIWRDGDIQTDQFPCRIDTFYALDMLRPEWAARICS